MVLCVHYLPLWALQWMQNILVGRPTLLVLPCFLAICLPLETHNFTGFGLGKLTSLGLAPIECAFLSVLVYQPAYKSL